MQDQLGAAITADGEFFDWLNGGEDRFFMAPDLGVAGPAMRRQARATRAARAATERRPLQSAS